MRRSSGGGAPRRVWWSLGFGRVLNPAQIQQNFEQSDSSWVARSMRKLFGMAEKPRAPPSSADPSALRRRSWEASTRSRRRMTSSTSAPSRRLTAPSARARPSCYSSTSPCPTSASPSYSDSSRSRRTSPPSAHPSCKLRSTPSSSSPARGSTPTASSCRARSPPPAASTSPRRRASKFNELTRSPAAVAEPISRLVELAVEIDAGKLLAASPNASAILYVLRLVARVDGFVRAVLTPTVTRAARHGARALARAARRDGTLPARGLECGAEQLAILRRCKERIVARRPPRPPPDGRGVVHGGDEHARHGRELHAVGAPRVCVQARGGG